MATDNAGSRGMVLTRIQAWRWPGWSGASHKAHGHWRACVEGHRERRNQDRGEYSRHCNARHKAADRCHTPDGCVRAESVPPIHAPTDQHPKAVLLDMAYG